MPKIEYEYKKFSSATHAVIAQANEIINTYLAQGYNLTLRQIYYQFVARALIPNTEQSYKRIGNIISDARRAGMIDWNAIVDRTRNLRKNPSWSKPQNILIAARDSYHNDLWANQPNRLEVWVEKDALVGVVQKACEPLDVPYFSCRGYVSDSEMWSAAQRAMKHFVNDQPVIVLHLGDHDPSGIDMTRDIQARYNLFSDFCGIKVRRIALTMEQIEELNPPPNPAKITDSRHDGYTARYGESSWELDALEPQFLNDLITDHILEYRDDEMWERAVDRQEEGRKLIDDLINSIDDDEENNDDEGEEDE